MKIGQREPAADQKWTLVRDALQRAENRAGSRQALGDYRLISHLARRRVAGLKTRCAKTCRMSGQ